MSAVGKIVEPQSSCADPTSSTSSAGEPECGSESDSLYAVRRNFNQWLWGSRVKLEQISPLEMGPLEPAVRSTHSPSCLCAACSVAGQVYADYSKAKRLRDDGP